MVKGGATLACFVKMWRLGTYPSIKVPTHKCGLLRREVGEELLKLGTGVRFLNILSDKRAGRGQVDADHVDSGAIGEGKLCPYSVLCRGRSQDLEAFPDVEGYTPPGGGGASLFQ